MKVWVFLLTFFGVASLLMYLVLPLISSALGISSLLTTIVGMIIYFFIMIFIWAKFGKSEY